MPDHPLITDEAVEAFRKVIRSGKHWEFALEAFVAHHTDHRCSASQPLTDRAPGERIDAAVHQMRDMPAVADDRLVKLGEVVEALRNAYHPQNPIPDHPADYIERKFGPKETPDA